MAEDTVTLCLIADEPPADYFSLPPKRAGNMVRTIFACCVLGWLALSSGCCSMCAHPYDYSGPVMGGGCTSGCGIGTRACSVLSPGVCTGQCGSPCGGSCGVPGGVTLGSGPSGVTLGTEVPSPQVPSPQLPQQQ